MKGDVKYKKDIFIITVLFLLSLIIAFYAAMEFLSNMFIDWWQTLNRVIRFPEEVNSHWSV